MNPSDTHCHVDLWPSSQKAFNTLGAFSRRVLSVTTLPSSYRGNLDRSSEYENLFVGLGAHPELAARCVTEMDVFDEHFDSSSFIGEIGLDQIKKSTQSSDQLSVLHRIIKRLKKTNDRKAVSIHSRGSQREIIQAFQPLAHKHYLVLHWFSGSPKIALDAARLGIQFSINPAMCKSKSGIEIIRSLPADSIHLESDAPFSWIKTPAQLDKSLNDLILSMAEIRKINVTELTNQIIENDNQLFSVAKI